MLSRFFFATGFMKLGHAVDFTILSHIVVRNYSFLKNYVISVGAVSHNVLYYQQLSIGGYQVRFCANNYFE